MFLGRATQRTWVPTLLTRPSSGWVGHIIAVPKAQKPLAKYLLCTHVFLSRRHHAEVDRRGRGRRDSGDWTVRWRLGSDTDLNISHLTVRAGGAGVGAGGRAGSQKIPGINRYLPRRVQSQITRCFALIPQVTAPVPRACFPRVSWKATTLSLKGVTLRITPLPQLPTGVPGSSCAPDCMSP